MDREALRTSFEYSKLEEQHFSGGCFSDEVRQQFESFKTLDKEQKIAAYADEYTQAFELASSLVKHPRFKSDKFMNKSDARCIDLNIDLTSEGLGAIEITIEEHEADPDEGMPAFKALDAWSRAFVPQLGGKLVYTHPGSLESNAQHIEYDRQHPPRWGEAIFLDDDLSDQKKWGDEELDQNILRVLDAKETLLIIAETLDD